MGLQRELLFLDCEEILPLKKSELATMWCDLVLTRQVFLSKNGNAPSAIGVFLWRDFLPASEAPSMARFHLTTLLIAFTPLLMASNCRKPPEDAVVDNSISTTVQSPDTAVQVAVVEPSYGPAEEAFEVEVIGSGFMQAARVQLGGVEAPRVRFLDENTLAVTVPALAQGSYDVTAINPDGSESTLRSGLALRNTVPEVRCEDAVVYFEYNSDEVTDAAKQGIKEASECMSEAEGQIVLEGHTDERGTTRYNLALGQRRAESVKRLFVAKGLSPNRMRSVSYGEERPSESGGNESAWSKNRRVEVKLVDP